MRQGKPYTTAIDFADAKERSERARTRDFAKITNKSKIPDSSKVHLQKLAVTPTGFTIWLVDGRLIRSSFDIDFTEGGHDLVYDFVPKNEIWLDNDLSLEERPFVLLHELFERSLMAKHLTYPQAHRRASRLEWHCHHHPLDLTKNLTCLGCSL